MKEDMMELARMLQYEHNPGRLIKNATALVIFTNRMIDAGHDYEAITKAIDTALTSGALTVEHVIETATAVLEFLSSDE